MKDVVCEVPSGRAVTPAPDPEPGQGEGRLPASGRDRLPGDGSACLRAAVAP
jgi:hypothetical protein